MRTATRFVYGTVGCCAFAIVNVNAQQVAPVTVSNRVTPATVNVSEQQSVSSARLASGSQAAVRPSAPTTRFGLPPSTPQGSSQTTRFGTSATTCAFCSRQSTEVTPVTPQQRHANKPFQVTAPPPITDDEDSALTSGLGKRHSVASTGGTDSSAQDKALYTMRSRSQKTSQYSPMKPKARRTSKKPYDAMKVYEKSR
jgi:hypothetical protein